jgi:hypothetical protein
VAASTVGRIESGRVDPGLETLTALADAAGFELKVSATRKRDTATRFRLADLATAWRRMARSDVPDWTRWRGSLDQLALHPEAIGAAIRTPPAASGSPVIDTLLAGVAEKLADDAGLPRPPWTRRAPKLEREWAMPGTPRMVEAWRASTPPQLRERGLVLDQRSLWRSQDTAGV